MLYYNAENQLNLLTGTEDTALIVGCLQVVT